MTLQAGYEPLLEAIRDADIPALDGLLSSNQFSVNTEIPYESEDGKPYLITPLYWAVKLGQRDVCRYLLQKNADPYRHMVYEYYPLHEACNRGDKDIVQEFIWAGCDLNQPNCDGDSALHIACMRGNVDCIRLLLSAGVNRMVRNVKGETPLQTAQFTNQTDLHKLFEVFDKDRSQRRSLATSTAHRPLSSDYSRLVSKSFLYHSCMNGSHDDTSVRESSHSQRKTDVTRTFSFSGSEASRYQSATRERPRYKSSTLLQQQVHSHRPSLFNMSHDSQLILPTQNLVSDPRRTRTCHDFGKSLPHSDDSSHQVISPPDEVEADNVPPYSQSQGPGPKLRVHHMIQYLNEAVITKYGSGFDSAYVPLLTSIRSDLNFSKEEYESLQLFTGQFCDKKILNKEQKLNSEVEYVWGCDYEMVDRNPIHVAHGTPTANYAEMVFKVKLHPQDLGHPVGFALLKVVTNIFDLGERDESIAYHSGKYHSNSHEIQFISSLPAHPNIAQLLHHCTAHSRPFERFTRLFDSDESHASLKMAPHVNLLFLRDLKFSSFESFLSSKKCLQSVAPYAIEENTALIFLTQLFLALSHLDQYGLVICYLTTADILFDHCHHLLLTGLSHAITFHHKDMTDVQNQLQDISHETSLAFSPELSYLRDCSSAVIAEIPPLTLFLKSSNSFTAARLFCDVFTEGPLFPKTAENYSELSCFSPQLRELVKKVMTSTHEDRPTAIQAALCCFILLFGPPSEDCCTLSNCQQWLVSETCHFFLRPSLKGQPNTYSSDIHTKLLFIYLLIVTPESLLSAAKLIYNTTNR